MRPLLLDLDPYGGTDPLGMFPLFLTRTAHVMAPRLNVVFRPLVRLGSFPAAVSLTPSLCTAAHIWQRVPQSH